MKPYYEDTASGIVIYHGRAEDVLLVLPSESVHCCVTSPPYWGLRDYGVAGQLGLEPTPEEYVGKLVDVFSEVRRVLRDDGTVFLNLGDSYFGSNQTGGTQSKEGSAKRLGRMFSRADASRHAKICGTSGKAPEDSPMRDCLCGSLCGVCHEVYRRTSHTDPVLESMLLASHRDSTREHTESENVHSPTSDLADREGRTEAANLDLCETLGRAYEPLRALLSSMSPESSRPLLAECSRRASRGACLLCGRSSSDCARGSGDKAECSCGTSSTLSSSALHSGIDCSGGRASDSYRHSTTQYQLKPKDLVGIPWAVAFALRADGWYLRSDIIWSKPNQMPESVTDRPTKAHEYIFLLSKSERYWYDAAAISEPLDGQPHAPGNLKLDSSRNDHDSMTKVWGASGKRNKRSVWTVATVPYPGSHFATFPPKLIEPCIKAGTSERGCCPSCGAPWRRVVERMPLPPTTEYEGKWSGEEQHSSARRMLLNMKRGREAGLPHDNPVPPRITVAWLPFCKCPQAKAVPCTVLDPFHGSGTTGYVAQHLGCRYVGIELNAEYIDLSKRRLSQRVLFGAA